jgi:hypothetical protein
MSRLPDLITFESIISNLRRAILILLSATPANVLIFPPQRFTKREVIRQHDNLKKGIVVFELARRNRSQPFLLSFTDQVFRIRPFILSFNHLMSFSIQIRTKYPIGEFIHSEDAAKHGFQVNVNKMPDPAESDKH